MYVERKEKLHAHMLNRTYALLGVRRPPQLKQRQRDLNRVVSEATVLAARRDLLTATLRKGGGLPISSSIPVIETVRPASIRH